MSKVNDKTNILSVYSWYNYKYTIEQKTNYIVLLRSKPTVYLLENY